MGIVSFLLFIAFIIFINNRLGYYNNPQDYKNQNDIIDCSDGQDSSCDHLGIDHSCSCECHHSNDDN